jgi:cytochrome c556
MKLKSIVAISVMAFAAATAVLAQATPEEALAAHETREKHMKAYGAQLGILGGMARGDTAYDAAVAQAAADELFTLANVDQSTWWPPESAAGLVEGSRALPATWENFDNTMLLNGNFVTAVTALQGAAGVDLASLQAAVGPVGASCGACHEANRAPE